MTYKYLVLAVIIRAECVSPLSQIHHIKDVPGSGSSQGKMPEVAQCIWKDGGGAQEVIRRQKKYYSEARASFVGFSFPVVTCFPREEN